MYVNITKAISSNTDNTVQDLDRRIQEAVVQLHKLSIERAQLLVHQAISDQFHPRQVLQLVPPE